MQKLAHAVASKDETMRSFVDSLSLEMSLGRGAEITVVAQKTITNAEIITLDHLCSGKVPTVTSLVMKLDPAENESDPHLLTKALHYLLRDITAKVKIGIGKFTEESVALYLTPPFRKMPRPPLARVSRGKVLNYVGRTSADPGMEPYPYMY